MQKTKTTKSEKILNKRIKELQKTSKKFRYKNKKNRHIKKVERELLQTLLELKNQQKAYKLLILNMFSGFVIILLIYLNFYKLALTGFGYLLIQNNSFIKKKFDVYLIQTDRFNKYYNKKFPIFYYVLPPIGILSGLGMFYTGYLLGNISQEILFDEVHILSCQPDIQSFQFLFTVFVIIFVFYLLLDMGIAIYVILKANSPIENYWKYFMITGRALKITAQVGVGLGFAGTVIAGYPEPTTASNVVNTKTLLGRGWDAEPGDICTKKDIMKLQQFTGNQFLLDKLDELNTGENKRIVTKNTYQTLLENPEVKSKIINAPNISNEELYQMGLKTLPNLAVETTEASVKQGFRSVGEIIDDMKSDLKNAAVENKPIWKFWN